MGVLSAEELPAVGGTYREAVVGQPRSLNPLLHPLDPVGRDLAQLIHAGLVRVTEAGEIRSELAVDWTTSADGLVYTFTLDRRARWSDGLPVTAADVIATVGFVRSSSYPGPSEVTDLWRRVAVEGIGERAVRFTLAEPYSSFIEACSIPIVPEEALIPGAPDAAELAPQALLPRGAGPFRVESIGPGGVLLRRNVHYVRTGPWLENVELRFFPSQADAIEALRRGEVDAFAGLSASAAGAIHDGGKLTLREFPMGGHQTTLLLNHGSAILSDPAARRAIALGLNREAMLDRVPGWGAPAFGPIPATSWAYAREVEVPLDTERSRQLLEEAGWRGSPVRSRQERPLQLQLAVPAQEHLIALAEEIAAQLRVVGFRIDVQRVDEIDFYQERIIPRTYEMALVGVWLGGVDPDPYSLWHSSQRRSGFNLAEYSDATTDALLAAARADGDPGRRLAALTAFQRRWIEDVPSVVLAHPVMRYAMPSDLQGVRLGVVPEPSARFQNAADWYLQTQRSLAFFR